MKIEKMIVKNENGEEATIDRADYIKLIVTKFEVKAYKTERSETSPPKLVDYIIKTVEAGGDIDEGINDAYPEVVTEVKSDVAYTMTNGASKKEAAAAEKAVKEAAKETEAKAKAETAAALVVTQTEFASIVGKGADKATQEYADTLKNIISSLPTGVTVVAQGHGFGLKYDKDVSKEVVAEALGYLMQTSANSSFIGNQLHFWIGDTISATVEKGIYSTAQEAATHIAKILSESSGKNIQAPSLDQYKRMAERTPIALRNPQADPTAYLLIAGMKSPKKDEKETDESFKARVSKFDTDRADLQGKLSTGEITKRGDMVPLVNEAMYSNGLKKRPDEKPPVSLSEWQQVFFHCCFALENLVGVHVADSVVYRDGKETTTVTKKELEEKKALAQSHLALAFYTSTKDALAPQDYIRGYVIKKAIVKLGEDQDGKARMGEAEVKNLAYPAIFFEAEKTSAEGMETEPAAETGSEPAAETPDESTSYEAPKGKKKTK